MSSGKRRLPEDSVVASLNEIQALIFQPPPVAPGAVGEPAPRPTAPVIAVGTVPSAAELRAVREARWQAEMEQPKAPAPAQRSRRGLAAGALGAALLLLAGGVATLQGLAPPAEAPAPAILVEEHSPAASPAPPAPAPPSVARPASSPSLPPLVRSLEVLRRPGRAPSRASGRAGSELDAVFGPRRVASPAGKPGAPAKPKRKQTHVDSQLDAVLDSL